MGPPHSSLSHNNACLCKLDFQLTEENLKKHVFIIVSEKYANAKNESQGAFTIIGTQHPKIFM